MSNLSDAYTAACPLYRAAQSKRARTGAAFEGGRHFRAPSPTWRRVAWIAAEFVTVAACIGAACFALAVIFGGPSPVN